MTRAPSPARDAVVAGALLALLLAWDASAADLALARGFGDAHGFAARDSFWAGTLLHSGGRVLAWLLALVLIATALVTPRRPARGPGRAERVAWLAVILLCGVAVPWLKRYSATSCPWDLAEFGGVARYVSHWHLGQPDGGGGHCFPSGHAVAAFAFLGMHFQWRRHDPARARGWLAAVLGVGVLFGIGQLARGAHYPSHTMWSAWLCWAICLGADALGHVARRRRPARLPAGSA
ncbi:phosphatase PAP2 family protein [Schlegelella sp. ID0723]|uniref:Phosphatase PAP2 family protein n=1 Tax=Piscinibacter koreensis TaxID=2742824 RepID=A0A7Y6TX33_9BURK|nr:phosphatase PAP2 family protein [Schlegelella koreensis]NUZ06606.1 phosphatase PAP2 family protein [Schlegelella koreensis]